MKGVKNLDTDEHQEKELQPSIEERIVAEFISNNYLFHPGMVEMGTYKDIKRAVNNLYRNRLIMQGII